MSQSELGPSGNKRNPQHQQRYDYKKQGRPNWYYANKLNQLGITKDLRELLDRKHHEKDLRADDECKFGQLPSPAGPTHSSYLDDLNRKSNRPDIVQQHKQSVRHKPQVYSESKLGPVPPDSSHKYLEDSAAKTNEHGNVSKPKDLIQHKSKAYNENKHGPLPQDSSHKYLQDSGRKSNQHEYVLKPKDLVQHKSKAYNESKLGPPPPDSSHKYLDDPTRKSNECKNDSIPKALVQHKSKQVYRHQGVRSDAINNNNQDFKGNRPQKSKHPEETNGSLDIENPVNIKIELNAAEGSRKYTIDEATLLPNIKHIPDHNETSFNPQHAKSYSNKNWSRNKSKYRRQGPRSENKNNKKNCDGENLDALNENWDNEETSDDVANIVNDLNKVSIEDQNMSTNDGTLE